jgi:hypothetical protein
MATAQQEPVDHALLPGNKHIAVLAGTHIICGLYVVDKPEDPCMLGPNGLPSWHHLHTVLYGCACSAQLWLAASEQAAFSYPSASFPHEDVFTSINPKERLECLFLYASVLTDLHCNASYQPTPCAEVGGQQV